MSLRRVHLGSLLVIALALAGATVAPSREIGRHATSLTWQADDVRRSPVVAKAERRRLSGAAPRPLPTATIKSRSVQAPLRHSLFQRPPPSSPNTP